MIRINLLAPERPTQKKQRAAGTPGASQAYLFLIAFTGAAVLLCAGAWWYKSSQIREIDAEIVKAQERQRQLQAIKVQVDALESKRSTFQKKVDLIEKLKVDQSAPVHMLDELSKALPDFVWLTELTQSAQSIALAGESTGLTSVADFISALQKSGWFPGADLSSIEESNNILKFKLQGTFKPVGIPSPNPTSVASAPTAGTR